MVTATQTLDTARILSRQKREKSKNAVNEAELAESPALKQALNLRHSKKNESVFKRMLRRKGTSQRSSTALSKVNPIHLATARGLQIAWIAVSTGVISAGLTTLLGLLYLNAHLMGRFIMPQVFAPFGSEWMPLKAKTLRTSSKFLGAFEIAVLLLLDLLILIAFMLIITFITSVIHWLSNNAIYVFFATKVLPILGISTFQ